MSARSRTKLLSRCHQHSILRPIGTRRILPCLNVWCARSARSAGWHRFQIRLLLSIATDYCSPLANHEEVGRVQLCFDFYLIEAEPENLTGGRAHDSGGTFEDDRFAIHSGLFPALGRKTFLRVLPSGNNCCGHSQDADGHSCCRQPANGKEPAAKHELPHDFSFLPINIITTITGTATTPLITALQNNALIGLIGAKLSAAPPRTAIAIVA